jgi:hypothetical protein
MRLKLERSSLIVSVSEATARVLPSTDNREVIIA